MIKGRNRFHGRNSLNGVYRKGKVFRGNSMAVRCLRSRRNEYRLAVVVSRKVSKSAVVRNRIRRRIYETVRLYSQDRNSACPYDLVITVFDERIATIETAELKAIIGQLLNQAAPAPSN